MIFNSTEVPSGRLATPYSSRQGSETLQCRFLIDSDGVHRCDHSRPVEKKQLDDGIDRHLWIIHLREKVPLFSTLRPRPLLATLSLRDQPTCCARNRHCEEPTKFRTNAAILSAAVSNAK